ncbi:MAG: hypothetical protein R3268_00195 [Acidiferrobacterales bacterium]|nr:hypothetical protein [Acidiferrobacterales bacterium]
MADAVKKESEELTIREFGNIRNHPTVKKEIDKLERIRTEQARIRKAMAEVNHGTHEGIQYDNFQARRNFDPVERALSDDEIVRMGNGEAIRKFDEENLRLRRKLEDLDRAEPIQVTRVNHTVERVGSKVFAKDLAAEVIGPAERIENALQEIENACSKLDSVFDDHKLLGLAEVWPEIRFPLSGQKYLGTRPTMPGKFEFQIKAWREQFQRIKDMKDAAE